MERKLEPLVTKRVLLPFILITSLFALWGFANSVTDPMVQAFKKVLELSNSQAAWVQMAFYGGYFSMALPAALFVRRYSYKLGVIVGLSLYAAGAFLFYPAALTEQFWFFCLGLYILTFGLAFLETTANPYILSMGTSETATRRLNLAQAFNPVGLVGGLLVAQNFVLEKLQSDDYADYGALVLDEKLAIRAADLVIIRDPYVLLGLSVLTVLILILVTKMPEHKGEGELTNVQAIVSSLLRKSNYILGVFAQVFYVGAQIMCWTYIYQYAEGIGISSAAAASYQFVAFLLFMVGRAIGTYLLKFVKPGVLLASFGFLAGFFTLLTVFVHGINGLYSLVAVSFFMSAMFPTIYGIALTGLREDEFKLGSAGLVMAIVGGAIMPKLQGMIIDLGGPGVKDTYILGVTEINFSFVLPLACLLLVGFYGVYVTRLESKIKD